MPNMHPSTHTIDTDAVGNFYNKIFVDDAVLHAVSTSVGRSSGTDGHQQRQQRCPGWQRAGRYPPRRCACGGSVIRKPG